MRISNKDWWFSQKREGLFSGVFRLSKRPSDIKFLFVLGEREVRSAQIHDIESSLRLLNNNRMVRFKP